MKTKIIKFTAILFCFTVMLNKANAQMVFNVGGNLGLVDFLGQNAPDHNFHPTLGLRAQLCVTEKVSAVFGFQYDFTSKLSTPTGDVIPSNATTTDTIDGYPVSEPSSYTSGTFVTKTTILDFYLHGHYDFVGDNTEGFGLYGYAGIGVISESVSTSVTGGVSAGYNTSSLQGVGSASTVGITIDFGLGAELQVQPVFIFAELGLGLAANSANGEELDQSIPSMFEFKAGVRYPFGGSDR